MAETNVDAPEFTDDQLRAALQRVGKGAREEAFVSGLSVLVLKDGALVEQRPDGTEEIVECLPQDGHASPERP